MAVLTSLCSLCHLCHYFLLYLWFYLLFIYEVLLAFLCIYLNFSMVPFSLSAATHTLSYLVAISMFIYGPVDISMVHISLQTLMQLPVYLHNGNFMST